ncbi:30S ribosomal protein S17 [Aeromicrobium sp.]|nr:30S ribosomal protein S17 [Candidatus Saccharibacteria bacterium]
MAKTMIGTVSSDKADKTIIVTVHTRKTHPLYRKQYSVSKKFMAHDENNDAHIGDKVEIAETRPLSARKRFTLTRIVDKPALREDSLSVVKSDDSGLKPSKAKAPVVESEDKN